MATTPVDYALLRAEPWWGREFAPPNLDALYVGVRAYLGRGPEAVGGKGDNRHRYGYHRSREWVLNSAYSAYGKFDYSVRDPRDLAGDGRWICAMDATPFRVETLIGMCQRLDRAVRAGELPQVREWYGNIDGNQIVDGWDAVTAKAATSDSSHLWHLHISFFRSLANSDHTHLLNVLTGGDDMMMTPAQFLALLKDPAVDAHMRSTPWRYVGGGIAPGLSTLGVLNRIDVTGQAVAARVDLDPDEIAAVTAANAAAFDEDAVGDRVLAGLAQRSVHEVADTLRAVLTPEQVAALAADLATG